MQLEAVSEIEQRTIARVAGAVAHELNNPLQGVLSLLSVMLRECRLDERCQLRLEQIHDGVRRLSRTVESLSAIYENLPRPPDQIFPAELLTRLTASLTDRDLHVHVSSSDAALLPVNCYAPEIVRLAGSVLSENLNGQRTVVLRTSSTARDVEVACTLQSESKEDEWLAVERVRGLSGAAVLLDEMVRLSQGTVEFRLGEKTLDGIRFRLPVAER